MDLLFNWFAVTLMGAAGIMVVTLSIALCVVLGKFIWEELRG